MDYDEYECGKCGRIGVWADGGFDYYCPACGHEGTIGEYQEREGEDDDDEDC